MRFEDFARARGLEIGRLVDNGKIQRCPTTAHPRSDNGAYVFDGRRGWVMAWDGDGEVHWWNDPDAKPWTEEQKREWIERRRADERAREARYARAAAKSRDLIKQCTLGKHGYLRLKGFPDLNALVLDQYTRLKRVDAGFVERTDESVLFVPMRDIATNDLLGAQMIFWDDESRTWVKEMVSGMRGKGAVLRLGLAQARETVLCEGFATGLSVQAAITQMRVSASVLVCFSDSNMVHVSGRIAGKVVVAADNDKSEAGERAAKAIGRPYFMSPTVGNDANDWHQQDGLLPLCAALMKARREASM